ncbi:hypothetical protein RN001_004797 [Aquatica leii]|uniref:Protein downstream neighbor of Son n=1 Tax=Aquatica leii TaxID=1421715 RepID=A0AAN7QJU0_9COLE|nr:hypothetical protein RN001_004797 [Aquatica leii]
MSLNDEANQESESKWLHPNELLKIQRFKIKKKQLQARFNKTDLNVSQDCVKSDFNISVGVKRCNPFIKPSDNNKRTKVNTNEDSCDQTLFQLLHLNTGITKSSNCNLLNQSAFDTLTESRVCNDVPNIISKQFENKWVPIDWSLNSKLRLLSSKPFAWSHKLKISEEASGITAFVRCLNNKSDTTLDTSPNAQFHQCCLYWQQPYLPWLGLFPRSQGNSSTGTSIATTSAIRDSLHMAWSDSLRSLFQLLRTRQCPYFYVCTNTFTVLFRAAGICGYTEMNALISPTTCGFRQLLKQEDIEFTLPLRGSKFEQNMLDGNGDCTDEEEPLQDRWLESMGINEEDRKQINYTQKRILHKVESEIDNTEQSLVLVQGMEVHGLYNFLINCKSATAISGSLAGIPPTLLSPIAFQGATLCALKVKESKIQVDKQNYFSIELNGPILPHVIHNLSELHPIDQNFTATFAHVSSTTAFSKVKEPEIAEKENIETSGCTVFGQENLSDCGLTMSILKHFCSPHLKLVQNVESLKYNPDKKSYTWL